MTNIKNLKNNQEYKKGIEDTLNLVKKWINNNFHTEYFNLNDSKVNCEFDNIKILINDLENKIKQELL